MTPKVIQGYKLRTFGSLIAARHVKFSRPKAMFFIMTPGAICDHFLFAFLQNLYLELGLFSYFALHIHCSGITL